MGQVFQRVSAFGTETKLNSEERKGRKKERIHRRGTEFAEVGVFLNQEFLSPETLGKRYLNEVLVHGQEGPADFGGEVRHE